MQSQKAKKDRTPFSPPTDHSAENAGYILWKGTKIVMFYTNDLKGTTTNPLSPGTSEEALKFVHGLVKLYRWTGDELLQRTEFFVPAPIVAYHMYMNSVDCMDQCQSTNPTW
eukprot:CAMPEP_0118677304 /NCGR_PEP_ID=MMETSP0800-20121206/2553_1 /TAXON_ID=210618 ORGANISM="Striatella unipunctata, Strain CCMP2910" /NCGR_SAMPLE_ID=MMETSP0800 /ASSEMBLY_ACC=CAM_ASM_000638 /LENGTH=111 /DNA_ID=CAMNT_0006572963 /DNA_START=878 /DNA_END=1210 /DNA_ORIENTATION=-